MHGGLIPSGPALPQYKHGRYSKALPARLADRYHEALSNPDLLAMRSDIAMAEARISELLTHLDASAGPETWQALSDALDDYEEAGRRKDTTEMLVHLARMRQLIRRGANDSERWEQIGDWLERKRKLSESEQKRLIAMQQMMTAEQAMVLAGALMAAIDANVTDRNAKAAIAREFARLIGYGDSRHVDSRVDGGGAEAAGE